MHRRTPIFITLCRNLKSRPIFELANLGRNDFSRDTLAAFSFHESHEFKRAHSQERTFYSLPNVRYRFADKRRYLYCTYTAWRKAESLRPLYHTRYVSTGTSVCFPEKQLHFPPPSSTNTPIKIFLLCRNTKVGAPCLQRMYRYTFTAFSASPCVLGEDVKRPIRYGTVRYVES